VLKIAKASLIFCVTAAVLAFGGTEPISFAVVEIVLLGAVSAVIVVSKDFGWAGSLGCAAVPAALIGLVIFQLVPLPEPIVRLLRPDNSMLNASLPGSEHHFFSSLSIAPYNTRIHLILWVCCAVTFCAHARPGSREQKTFSDMVGGAGSVRSALWACAVSDWLAEDFWVCEEI
jgi:hypothetical protein